MSRNQDIRVAAESLLGSVTSPNIQYRSFSNSQSINLLREELVAGHRPHGRMSSVRRFFCLFVTFDLLFTSLMWLICVMVSLMWLICVMMRGETLLQIFQREIIHYDVKSSLFDIVLVAISRFVVLLLFYGLLYISNWSVIALSTGGSCLFLIGKVFVFDWPDAYEPVYEVFLILSSFVLSWGEAWFLDFRVLPQECMAKEILHAIVHDGNSEINERTSLLNPQRPLGVQSTYGESTANWFSPVDTPEASPRPRKDGQEVILTQEQIDEYKTKAVESMQSAWSVINLPNWRLEKRGVTRGDIVESIQTERYGKVYRFTGIVECPAKFLFQEFRDNIVKLPEWNPTVLKSELIKQISEGIDLTYQITAGGGRGIIAPRDFVNLRLNAGVTRDGQVTDSEPYAYISSGGSVNVPGYPPHNAEYVRGHNKVGCWLMKPKTVQQPGGKIDQHTVFQWLMCCDLKGKIPQFVLDAAFATVMLEYIVHVRKFAAEAKARGLF